MLSVITPAVLDAPAPSGAGASSCPSLCDCCGELEAGGRFGDGKLAGMRRSLRYRAGAPSTVGFLAVRSYEGRRTIASCRAARLTLSVVSSGRARVGDGTLAGSRVAWRSAQPRRRAGLTPVYTNRRQASALVSDAVELDEPVHLFIPAGPGPDGARDFSNVLGFVPDPSLIWSFFQSETSQRAIVAGDIEHCGSVVSSLTTRSPWPRRGWTILPISDAAACPQVR